MLAYFKEFLPEDIVVKPSDALGINSDAKEAFVFALLGYLGFHKVPNNLPSTTGAKRQTILGKIAW
ncbi:anhydro-N-acetylmuramic acid kinase [Psychrobacillus sp. NEAU-3TGS]|uniref:anhydro-N-acetylmuramic acid kinase n=1 Tax=Psychrobacillus sp. NEAU-3TGS TaxID=2995412 RepID=UPI002499A50D|nr:anhydro-N-acetylmuramic acid kinase [Psychrobacillus sp. NEAU-3TGS]MDI2587188.1 anhydro-N-acetylmuramic acid kinase [Psychrobacillus sp. NEAU-3TGS]